ncbi:MAG: hypothetical protein ABI761_06755 [Saprospiraceae bacterium]
MQRELFREFNERYDKLNSNLYLIKDKYPTLSDLETAENPDQLKNTIIDFFNLCAEEYYWYHHKGRIDKLIWTSWQDGMNFWFKVPAIQDLWRIEVDSNGMSSYYIDDNKGFFMDNSKENEVNKS